MSCRAIKQIAVITFLILFLVGCVVLDNPAGSEVYKSKSKFWEGTWIGTNNVYFIDASQSMAGTLTIYEVSKEKEGYKLVSFKAYLRKNENTIFLNIPAENISSSKFDLKPKGWYCLALERQGDSILLSKLNDEKITKLIQQEKLKGLVKSSPVVPGSDFVLHWSFLQEDQETLATLYQNNRQLYDKYQRQEQVELFPKELTKISRYQEFRQNLKELSDHFPEEIPVEAKKVRISYIPGYFQSAAVLHLHMFWDEKKIQALRSELKEKAIAIYEGSSQLIFNKHNKNLESFFLPRFHTSDSRDDFTEDYQIFILTAEKLGSHSHWNHGRSQGVVIHKTKNEVIYFAEMW